MECSRPSLSIPLDYISNRISYYRILSYVYKIIPKQAGNSITVDVFAAIINKLKL